MDIQGLKDKILQLAIQGKLVEQNPNDEPASALLERIKEERDKLVKEKKIKKGKPLPEITEEEKPFAIPESWEWVRLGEISKIISKGTTPKGGRNAYKDKGVYFLRVENLTRDFGIDLLNVKLVDVGVHESQLQRSIGEENDLLISIAGTLGRVAVLKKEHLPCNMNQAICFVRVFYEKVNVDYLKYIISSLDIQKSMISKTKTTAQPNLTLEIITDLVIPLPPLAEQKRIVEKVDQLFALIDELDSNKVDLLEVINLTRNQVLQEAIQGKLVEQNPEDEPASALLNRIKEERDKLVKEGKIRKEKPLPEITEEEKPFELPEGWEWIRLGEVIQLISGRDEPVSDCNDEGRGLPYIMGASNIEDEKLLIERWIVNPRVIAKKHDLILTVKGTVGKMIILKEYEEVNLSRQVVALRQISNMYSDYLYWFIKSHINVINNKSQGVIPGISRSDILEIIFPLPPLAEQKLIVEKLDNIMNMLDALEKTII